ncbi:Embryogenesis-associated protein EMB8 [Apostasia shenzhenica]|uniref:Embryogenesis-associated protein EMB8 n=1 Tax=Apostasia shenzhenica TaxID=1088818 RepID=A0A2H9ZUU1_9ASPA|nr:Embryogenesis-associated protein EMB8 [Apostasia shenzhenica]
MNVRCLSPHLNLRSTLVPCRFPVISRHDPRRQRRRRPTKLRCYFDLESLLNAVPPLDLLAPVVGMASAAAAVYLRRALRPDGCAAIGEWVLFTSPTPFNRCVLLRCPSISFEDGGELLDSANDRFLREERHYVNLNRGRIPVKDDGFDGAEKELKYQRVYVRTDDDGVISMDWPDNLDMEKEHGLDTTVLIVPGTPEGSMDRYVRYFVLDAIRHGCFPVVMNPRGCAGSALTTARLFTAADSDDVCTALQFVNGSRPWTTLMVVGSGYGASMLTKYLAEVGETTPVTAAVCIDTPFDLKDSTKSSPHHVAMDKKLAGGLREILQANKELFQGKAKGFDVAKALSATTVRDFDRAVSMISYGFDDLEEFYKKSSTRQLIGNLKIPIIFIQSDDGTVPLFSIPRSSIADNPFTSLLLCSCLPSTINKEDQLPLLWCQQLAIEWLSAVEHALLKGRHPLLSDVDITVKPSKDLTFSNYGELERSFLARTEPSNRNDSKLFLSHNHGDADSFLELTRPYNVNGFLVDPLVDKINGNTSRMYDKALGYRKSASKFTEMQRDYKLGEVGESQKHGVADAFPFESGDNPTNSEGSQVMQTASVVMNMLGVTMPGTLDDEQKKKVLGAMEQGETFMKALHDAVPEEVRGKITTAVSNIMQSKGTNLNIEQLKGFGWVPKMTSDIKSKIQGNINGNVSPKNCGPLEHTKNSRTDDDRTQENIGPSQEKATQSFGCVEDRAEVDQTDCSDRSDQGGMNIEDNADQYMVTEKIGSFDKLTQDNQVLDDDIGCTKGNEVQKVDSSAQQDIPRSTTPEPAQSEVPNTTNLEEAPSPSSSASINSALQVPEEGNENQKNEERTSQDGATQNAQASLEPEDHSRQHLSSKLHSISVTQALDALTGFDDSTQMAVNSVFGVIENMIDQLEKNQENDEAKHSEGQKSVKTAIDGPLLDGEKSEHLNDGVNYSGTRPEVNKLACHADSILTYTVAESLGNTVGYVGHRVNNLSPSSGKSSDQQSGKDEVDYSHLNSKNLKESDDIPDLTLDAAMKRYWLSPYAAYIHRFLSTPLPSKSSSYLGSATELFLDPEEGQWKMLDQIANSRYKTGQSDGDTVNPVLGTENVIEPSYVIPDGHYSCVDNQLSEYDTFYHKQEDARKEKLFILVKNTLLDDLKVQIGRRIGKRDLEELDSLLTYDLENFTNKISWAVLSCCDLQSFTGDDDADLLKFGSVEGQQTVNIILSALQSASLLRKVLPFGVIVGSTLASLRTYFHVVALHDDTQRNFINKPVNNPQRSFGRDSDFKGEHLTEEKIEKELNDHYLDSNNSTSKGHRENEKGDSSKGRIVVGAVTAALGSAALLANHQTEASKKDENVEMSSALSKKRLFSDNETMHEQNQNNLVSSIAEKAMSVAGPIVPTKDDGEVDQERLVAMLAELGQKGGVLRLIGKVALLWGGIRGAMSLTDRLISFLHIAERPLFQRVFGFICMVLVLWSPLVIPLLPTLVQSWTTHTSNRIVELGCIMGLYISAMILVILWGKRIRGYDNPIEQYGLDLTSAPRVLDFLKGLAGGIMIVACIHSINALLGYASLSLPVGLSSSSSSPIITLKAYGNMLLLAVQGVVSASGVSIVEELLFRSWLAEEIAADLGYCHAIMISGLMFALIQRSLTSVPGLLLLSLSLFGIKQRAHGKLAAPIGVRSGLMTANYVIQSSNLLSYRAQTPFWLASTHPWHPLDGAVGLSFCALLAIIFFPRLPVSKKS